MSPAELLTITLYVPDATVRRLSVEGWLRRRLQDGTGDLDFLVPGWWEGSHTVRLGAVPAALRPGSVAAGDDRGSVGWVDRIVPASARPATAHEISPQNPLAQ